MYPNSFLGIGNLHTSRQPLIYPPPGFMPAYFLPSCLPPHISSPWVLCSRISFPSCLPPHISSPWVYTLVYLFFGFMPFIYFPLGFMPSYIFPLGLGPSYILGLCPRIYFPLGLGPLYTLPHSSFGFTWPSILPLGLHPHLPFHLVFFMILVGDSSLSVGLRDFSHFLFGSMHTCSAFWPSPQYLTSFGYHVPFSSL